MNTQAVQTEQARSREEVPGNGPVPIERPGPRPMDAEFATADAYNNIIRRAVTNPYYRRRLISDPKAVLKEAGVPVPAGVEVRVRPFEEETRYIFLPPADSSIAQAIDVTSAVARQVATESGREASVSINWWSGIVLTLEHEEVQTLLQYIDAGQDITEFLGGLGLNIPALALRVVAFFLGLQAALIREFDRGNGVYLTLPWPAIWWQQWWLIIPGPR